MRDAGPQCQHGLQVRHRRQLCGKELPARVDLDGQGACFSGGTQRTALVIAQSTSTKPSSTRLS